jgi:hypothetical protein
MRENSWRWSEPAGASAVWPWALTRFQKGNKVAVITVTVLLPHKEGA